MKKKSLIWEKIGVTIALSAIILLSGIYVFAFFYRNNQTTSDSESTPTARITVSSPALSLTPVPTVSPTPLPNQVLLDVPFLVQAPFAIWDALHEEACEEASLIMVKYFRDGAKIASREAGDKEITDLIDFQSKNGYAVDVTVAELAKIASAYYSMPTGRVEKQASIQAIKQELAAGRPVIVPAAGRILPNPYFTGGGPDYHMLVIKGYDENGFITNDPGTRRGENFRYSYNDLLNAIHDWNQDNILEGEKSYLVFD